MNKKWIAIAIFTSALFAIIAYVIFLSNEHADDTKESINTEPFAKLITHDYEVLGAYEDIDILEIESEPESSEPVLMGAPEQEGVDIDTEQYTNTLPPEVDDEEIVDGNSIQDDTIEEAPKPIIEKIERKILTVDIYSEDEVTEELAEQLASKIHEKHEFYTLVLNVFAEKEQYKQAVKSDYTGKYGLYHATHYTPFYESFIHYNFIDTSIAEGSDMSALDYEVFDIENTDGNIVVKVTAKGDVLDATLFVGAFESEVKALNNDFKSLEIAFYADQTDANVALPPYWLYKDGMIQFDKTAYNMPESNSTLFQ